MAEDRALSATIVAVGQTLTAYQFFLPDIKEIRRNPDKVNKADVRMGQVAAAATSLMIGILLGQLTDSGTPFLTSLLVGVVIIAMYEMALQGNRIFE